MQAETLPNLSKVFYAQIFAVKLKNHFIFLNRWQVEATNVCV